MLTGPSELRSQPRLRLLLEAYARLAAERPDAQWQDRVMMHEGCEDADLVKLHGALLAAGWVETRVHSDSLRTAGKLEACYRITPDGRAALRLASAAPNDSQPMEGDEEPAS